VTDHTWCEAEIFAATRIDPAEYCEEEAEPGSEFCTGHRAAAEARDDYEPPDRDDFDICDEYFDGE
jgi:hypothetical protein